MICLDKSPVKPVMIETNVTERNTDTDKKEGEKEETDKSHKDQKEELNPTEAADKPVKSEKKDGEKNESCICKKPVSFELLPPSKRGKLASRQRFASESSYKKQHYPMVHTNSDPTGLDSKTVFEDEEDVKTENVEGKDKGEKVKIEEEKDTTKTDIDTLADNLGSALKIASTSTSESKVEVKEEADDKQISDLADNLQTSLHVKDKEQEDSSGSNVIIVKKEDVSISAKEEIVIKKEPVDDDEKSVETIEIKQEPKDETSESCKKEGEAGSVSGRLPENNKKMLSRGVQGDGQTPFQPMQGMYYPQHSYQQSGNTNIAIPSFQEAFVRNDQQQQMQLHYQRQLLSQQRRHVPQSVQPPRYLEGHHQQQQIILPPSTQGSQPIVVPPAATNVNHQTNFQTQQVQHRQFGTSSFSHQPHQNRYPMPLQEPQMNMVVLPSSRKQPEENAWPGTHDDLSDTTSTPSPYHGEDIDLIASPPSVGSDIALNQVNSPLSSQGSPHSYTPTSPCQTVPTLSPEMPLAHSPSAVPSPGSPNSHTITTGGSNFGVVTINKPSSPQQAKRQRFVRVRSCSKKPGHW